MFPDGLPKSTDAIPIFSIFLFFGPVCDRKPPGLRIIEWDQALPGIAESFSGHRKTFPAKNSPPGKMAPGLLYPISGFFMKRKAYELKDEQEALKMTLGKVSLLVLLLSCLGLILPGASAC